MKQGRVSPTTEAVQGSARTVSLSSFRGGKDDDVVVEDDASADSKRFREYQSQQWDDAFRELLDFRRAHGHCQVPHDFKENRSLSRWVKHQRYQYKLLKDGKSSLMQTVSM